MGALSARAERVTCRVSVKWGRVVVSWCAVVLAPPQMTRFPLAVHLAAEACTWVGLVRSRAALMVAQISDGVGF